MLDKLVKKLRSKLELQTILDELLRVGRVVKSLRNVAVAQGRTIHSLEQRLDDQDRKWQTMARDAGAALSTANSLNRTSKQLIEHFELGINVGVHDPSWGVLIIRGPQPKVSFIDLRGASPQRIEAMLNMLSDVPSTVDAPYNMPGIKPIKRF